MPDKKYKVVFTNTAELEILNIYSYILDDSPINANKWIDELQSACMSLANFPERHSEFKYTSEPSRQMIFNHTIRVIYTINDDSVVITHCMRCEQKIRFGIL